MALRLRFTIRAKLVVLGIVTAAVALGTCLGGVMMHNVVRLEHNMVSKLQAQATMLAFNSTAVLTFRDVKSATALLAAYQLEHSVDQACLYDSQGQIFAQFSRDPSSIRLPIGPLDSGHRYGDSGSLELFQPVIDQGERVGTLYVRANLRDYYADLRSYAGLVGFVSICALSTALTMAFGLQRRISGPIIRLADASRRITTSGDYSTRVECDATDEIGQLYRCFNEMLNATEASQIALKSAHAQLEHRVVERTAQLQQEIAQRVAIEADLVRAKNAAEAANRAKSEFLANMSHEIRTPLNGVLGFTKLLLKGADGGDPARRREFLETIQRSGELQLELINDILDLSKIEAGQMVVDLVRTSPHDIIAEVLSVLRVRADDKGLSLNVNWVCPIPETIETDPTRFRQLVMNLVGNAIKFTETGGVQILVHLQNDQRDPLLVVEVVDTGIGIPPEKLETIFEPFVQADCSVTRRFGGTGLGLAISQRIARALGGDITVTSEIGEGSIFRATLQTGSLQGIPLLAHSTEVLNEFRRPNVVASVGELALSGYTVLLVEDGETNRKLIELVLRNAGALVASAENGQIGVEMALTLRFDCILMDMQMPVMDGYTAASMLRTKGYTRPIIALTAHAMTGDGEKCRHAGCSGFLTKPIDPDTLIAALVEALGSQAKPASTLRHRPRISVESGHEAPLVSQLPLDDAEFREIVVEFIQRLDIRLAELRQAIAAVDLTKVAELAHWVKGSAGTAGFPAFTEPSGRLEQAARSGQQEQLAEGFAKLESLRRRIEVPVA